MDLASGDLLARKERDDQALSRLDGITLMLPDPERFLYQYVRKEALLSSQIEGTQSSLADLLLYELNEAPGVPVDDVDRSAQVWVGGRTPATAHFVPPPPDALAALLGALENYLHLPSDQAPP